MNKNYAINNIDFNNIRFVTSDSVLSERDSCIICNAEDDIELTLHSASGSRKSYLIKNVSDVNVVTVITTGADLIDYVEDYSTWMIYMYESVIIIDYAVNNWVILSATIWWPFWFGDGV